MKSVQERFDDKWSPVPEAGCWLWEGDALSSGYGRMKLNGEQVRAHRVSYDLHKGPIPEGMHILHKCDTPACVNPDHLWAGTHAENMADRAAKGRGVRGASVCTAKLNDESAMEVYQAAGSQRAIAKEFGISQFAVHQIKTKKTWKHIHQEAAA